MSIERSDSICSAMGCELPDSGSRKRLCEELCEPDASEPGDLSEIGRVLHSRLVAGHSGVVTAQIAEIFLPPLFKMLKRSFSHLSDLHEIEEQAAQSLLNYFKSPEKFDPARGSLLNYLRTDASYNLRTMMRKRSRRAELSLSCTEHLCAPDDTHALHDLDQWSCDAELKAIPRRIRESLTDPVDRQLLVLMLEGVRRTEDYALILGIGNLEREEQKRVVKRHKDRLKKQIHREIQKHHRGWLQSALRWVRSKQDRKD